MFDGGEKPSLAMPNEKRKKYIKERRK